MAIKPLPTPPSRADAANFSDRADAFMAQLPTFANEANALQADVNTKQSTASTAATTATTKAAEANTSASNAAASASSASTSATNASASATDAQKWAIKTDGPVSGSEYSAKYWGQIAQGYVVGSLISDNTSSTVKVWSSSKISSYSARLSGGNTFVGGQNFFNYGEGNTAISSSYSIKVPGNVGGYLLEDGAHYVSLYTEGGGGVLNFGFGDAHTIASKYSFSYSGDFTAAGRVTTNGITSSSTVDATESVTVYSPVFATVKAKVTGQDSVYLFSNDYSYGIYSQSGGSLVNYERSTGKSYFAGIDAGRIVLNEGGSYNIQAAGLSSSPGIAPHYACRAWVQFNGTTMAVYGSGNVRSITERGVGDYIVNFSADMPDANYAVSVNCAGEVPSGSLPYAAVKGSTGATASSVRIGTGYEGAPSGADMAKVFVAVFR